MAFLGCVHLVHPFSSPFHWYNSTKVMELFNFISSFNAKQLPPIFIFGSIGCNWLIIKYGSTRKSSPIRFRLSNKYSLSGTLENGPCVSNRSKTQYLSKMCEVTSDEGITELATNLHCQEKMNLGSRENLGYWSFNTLNKYYKH